MRRRLTWAVTAAAATMALAGCSSTSTTSPGVAAEVDGHAFTTTEVDDLAEALCAVNSAQASSAEATEISGRQVRGAAVSRLVQVRLAEQLGEEEGIRPDESRVAQQLKGVEEQLADVPDEQLDTFMDSYARLVRGADVLTQLGRRSLQEQGRQAVDDAAALAEGGMLLQEYAREADVEVDPRFGTFEDGQVVPGDGSLSVPVSRNAVDGVAPEPSPAFLSGLPATQKCA